MFNQFIVNRFQSLTRGNFNGKLNIESDSGQKWSLLFDDGQLIWATGGSHQARRWRRNLLKHCPEIAPSATSFRSNDEIDLWQYKAILILVKRETLSQEQAIAIIKDSVAEVLFDIIQQGSLQQLNYTITKQKQAAYLVTRISTEEALKQAIQAWEAWEKAGLTKVSPHLAPVVRQREQLQQQSSAPVYQSFTTLITGNNTLRDLSVQMKQDLLLLTRSLIPYIRKGIIGFIEIPDLPTTQTVNNTTENPASTAPNNSVPKADPTDQSVKAPLIACVDDSLQTCQMMEQIFKAAGFRFLSIQDSVQALPTLIAHKPDLIFLDLMMPVVNGYEICAQLRRISIFTNTPLIILTGSDGLVDRVRAKVVGASDFLAKPVEAQKVLAAVSKYLSATSSASKESKLQLSQPTLESS